MTSKTRIASWTLQLLVAAILVQTLFFKFTAAAESVYIFQTLGMEPWGRIGSGLAELAAAALLIVLPRFLSKSVIYGALLTLAVIAGAIFSHLTKLGIVVQNDGGTLFVLALIVFASSLAILILRRRELPFIGQRTTA